MQQLRQQSHYGALSADTAVIGGQVNIFAEAFIKLGPEQFLGTATAHQDIGIALTKTLCQKQQRSQAQAAANQQRFLGAHIEAVS